MFFKQTKYSKVLKPISYIIDLSILTFFVHYLSLDIQKPYLFLSYIVLFWVILSVKNEFYEVRRYSKITLVLSLVFRQFFFFFLILYAYIGFFKEYNTSRLLLLQYFLIVFGSVFLFKILLYFLLKKYRGVFGKNFRKVVVLGKNKKADQLVNIFNTRADFGFKLEKQFCVKDKDFDLNKCFSFISENEIDEIYCSISELNDKNISEIIAFANNNLKELKFLPDNKNIFTKKLKFEYYDYLPILSLREIPLDDSINSFVKRMFDILFSSIIILLILSWLTPLMAILIRIESKGPIFFRQRRNGLDNREFDCYKFRSMSINEDSDKIQATKNDMRITTIGKFIRKTSIDELPQFYNVFTGRMSVVGPRPHMVKHTDLYSQKIDKYMVRHFVKPGITGLAQVRGYRGEIEVDKDIINRVKFDIFYIENWSLFLDLKIILQTVINAIKGDDKAY